jgi:hypothetical protein
VLRGFTGIPLGPVNWAFQVEVMRLCSNPSLAADLENCGSKVRTMAELGLFGVSRGVGRGSDGTTFEPRPERRCGAHFLASKG